MSKLLKLILAGIISLTAGGCEPVIDSTPAEIPFAVHYIDVGQADAALVVCDDEAMMIDGGNVADSSLIAAYLKEQGIEELEYAVCTHAHEDHVGGLSAALSVAKADNVYAPYTEANIKAYKNFKKKAAEQGLEIQHPGVGDMLSLGDANIEFLGPVNEKTDDLNNTSIVLKITYGETSFLFMGDTEKEEEHDIIDSGADVFSTVLKVGHHGSNSSSTYSFLREVMPQYAVISVGEDNSYGHPSDKVLSRLGDAGAEIFRTDESGHIVMGSDGKNIKIITEK